MTISESGSHWHTTQLPLRLKKKRQNAFYYTFLKMIISDRIDGMYLFFNFFFLLFINSEVGSIFRLLGHLWILAFTFSNLKDYWSCKVNDIRFSKWRLKNNYVTILFGKCLSLNNLFPLLLSRECLKSLLTCTWWTTI